VRLESSAQCLPARAWPSPPDTVPGRGSHQPTCRPHFNCTGLDHEGQKAWERGVANSTTRGRPKRVFRRDEAMRMREQGTSGRRIGAELDVPVTTVVKGVPVDGSFC
jgi:hypothetical protein